MIFYAVTQQTLLALGSDHCVSDIRLSKAEVLIGISKGINPLVVTVILKMCHKHACNSVGMLIKISGPLVLYYVVICCKDVDHHWHDSLDL